LGPVLFLVVLLLPPPAALSPEGWRVAAVAVLMATWWVTEAIPIPATALLPLVLFPLLEIVSIGAAAAPFANPVIYLFMGGFLIAAALQRCGLHRRIALSIVRFGGGSPARLVGSFMAATAFISMWVSNTATVAMLLPMALSVIELAEDGAGDATRLHLAPAMLLGLAYAASIGGLGTLIGTPPNALLAGFMAETYDVSIGFLEWMLLGVPIVLVSLPLAWLLLTRVLHPMGSVRLAGGREVLLAQARALGRLSRAEWTVGIITAMTAAAWLTQPMLARLAPSISDAGIAIGGALLLFLVPIERSGARALDWDAAERLPWGVLVLFGGGLSLANAVQETGLAAWIGEAMAGIGAWPVILVVVAVTTVIVFLTELTSNTATAAAFLPVVSSLAVAIGASPLLLAVPTALGASCAFMMPVATPPNAIVFGSGRLTMPQMMRAGLWLNLLFIVLITAAAVWMAPRLLGR
jgi:sodium-dependent dicarboxylate transporter 2/3/5